MNIGAQFGPDPGKIAAVCAGALLFGVLYAIFIANLRNAGRLEGYTSLAVVAGVLVTLGLAAILIGVGPALFVLLTFVGAGLPMIVADIWHYTTERRRRSQELRQLVGGDHGDQT